MVYSFDMKNKIKEFTLEFGGNPGGCMLLLDQKPHWLFALNGFTAQPCI